jgi:hypothetical protein
VSDDTYSMRVLQNGIVVFRLPNLARQTIDGWIEDLARLGQAWIDEEMALLLVDMRNAGVMTPYVATKLREISKTTPATTQIRTAFMFDAGPPMALSGRYLQGLGPLLGTKRAFAGEPEAIAWLCEVL